MQAVSFTKSDGYTCFAKNGGEVAGMIHRTDKDHRGDWCARIGKGEAPFYCTGETKYFWYQSDAKAWLRAELSK